MKLRLVRGFLQVFLVILLGLITGCTVVPYISQKNLLVLDKGMSVDQVEVKFATSPLSSKEASQNSRVFLFQLYEKFEQNQRHSYYLAFDSSELIYWGYLSEFRRQPDNDMIKALDKALPYLKVPAKYRPKY